LTVPVAQTVGLLENLGLEQVGRLQRVLSSYDSSLVARVAAVPDMGARSEEPN